MTDGNIDALLDALSGWDMEDAYHREMAHGVVRRWLATAPTQQGCSIHGPCHICRGLAALGDPRIGVSIGPAATFQRPIAPDAAANLGPSAFGWFCTKHGQIPYQDCAMCKAESSERTSAEHAK